MHNKKIRNLNETEVKKIINILKNPNEEMKLAKQYSHPDRWMLEYAYNSKLRKEFERNYLN